MYKYLLCYLILLATLSTSFAQDLPAWAKKLPKAGNNTFMYVCEWGVGPSETSAANQALGKVFQTTANPASATFATAAAAVADRIIITNEPDTSYGDQRVIVTQ